MLNQPLRPLAITVAAGGIWDAFLGIGYVFLIGTGRSIDQPPPLTGFYAIFIGQFFLAFAYLQLLSAFNIRRYLITVGVVAFGRLFYLVQMVLFTLLVGGLTGLFYLGAVIDAALVGLCFFFALRGGRQLRDLFLPARGPIVES
ncbi:MAG: hypothetical protein JSU77_05550 [Fidelibacterota bacterium]|nr:MAG: hypothetical protein JSU77_05550 [Candidatus Neomarinimicrobiota bacterium]